MPGHGTFRPRGNLLRTMATIITMLLVIITVIADLNDRDTSILASTTIAFIGFASTLWARR